METAVHEYMVLGVFPSHFITPGALRQEYFGANQAPKKEPAYK